MSRNPQREGQNHCMPSLARGRDRVLARRCWGMVAKRLSSPPQAVPGSLGCPSLAGCPLPCPCLRQLCPPAAPRASQNGRGARHGGWRAGRAAPAAAPLPVGRQPGLAAPELRGCSGNGHPAASQIPGSYKSPPCWYRRQAGVRGAHGVHGVPRARGMLGVHGAHEEARRVPRAWGMCGGHRGHLVWRGHEGLRGHRMHGAHRMQQVPVVHRVHGVYGVQDTWDAQGARGSQDMWGVPGPQDIWDAPRVQGTKGAHGPQGAQDTRDTPSASDTGGCPRCSGHKGHPWCPGRFGYPWCAGCTECPWCPGHAGRDGEPLVPRTHGVPAAHRGPGPARRRAVAAPLTFTNQL